MNENRVSKSIAAKIRFKKETQSYYIVYTIVLRILSQKVVLVVIRDVPTL